MDNRDDDRKKIRKPKAQAESDNNNNKIDEPPEDNHLIGEVLNIRDKTNKLFAEIEKSDRKHKDEYNAIKQELSELRQRAEKLQLYAEGIDKNLSEQQKATDMLSERMKACESVLNASKTNSSSDK